MWVIVEFRNVVTRQSVDDEFQNEYDIKITNEHFEVTEVYGPFRFENVAMEKCEKFNKLYKNTYYEVYELNDSYN